ncbi:major facilitator superfamily transporter [Diplocarpon rosae]|nr:major facilitator superfamily transporter [Diplocarpon rosae]
MAVSAQLRWVYRELGLHSLYGTGRDAWLVIGARCCRMLAFGSSILSTLTGPESRADVLAWYVTVATLGQSVGTEAGGRAVQYLQHREGWSLIDAYHAVFWVYSAVGVLNMIFMASLSSKCEAPQATETSPEEAALLREDEEGSQETAEVEAPAIDAEPKKEKQRLFAQISPETRGTMLKLWLLLVADSLADGMTPYTLTTYYMDQKFHMAKSTLGDITSISYFLSFFSTIFAAPLCRRLGLINTMVFTHLPSSAAVLLFPLPSTLAVTVVLLMIRTGLNNMDQAPRAAFIAAVVQPGERTAIMGITSMLRTLASAAGPTVTGVLAGRERFWVAFVAAGALRIAYDLGLFALFVNMKLHEHEERGEPEVISAGERRESDEEEVGTCTR